MMKKIIEEFPQIQEMINDGEIKTETVIAINEEMTNECNWCPFNTNCEVCGGLVEMIMHEMHKDYDEEEALQALYEQERDQIVYDLWENNIGECKAHFYGVCKGELTGKACEEPSEYGCSFKLPSSP